MRAIKDLTQLKLTMGAKEYIEGQLDARLGRIESRFAGIDIKFAGIESRFAGIDTRLGNIENQMGSLRKAFYVVTGVYSALLAFTMWYNTQLANSYQTQLNNTTITLSGRIDNLAQKVDNLAEKYDAQFALKDKELKLQGERIEDQRRKTDLLYKKLGFE